MDGTSSGGTFQSRCLQTIDRALDAVGLFHRPLRPDRLIERACQREKLDDFGDWSFAQPLEILLRAYETEAQLSTFGRFGARWDVLRFLSNLLRLRAEEIRDPSIITEPIERPIFILGLPRSGTTFLHNLMGEDPENLVPRAWQTIFPYPDRNRRRGGDGRERLVARQFSTFLRIAPELPSLHPLDAAGAQECIEITGHVMRSLRFDTTHYVPSYANWLDSEGHLEAYRFHRRFLQHLQHQGGRGRWVLKSPDHIFAFDALQQVYPDARFVFVHRDPLKVLPSVARLTEILRRPFARRVDRSQIGRQVSTRWAQGAALLIEAADRLRTASGKIIHVRYEQLVRAPIATVEEVYRHLGIRFSKAAEHAMRRAIAIRPNGGYGRNLYRWEDYGLSALAQERQFAAYMARFRVGRETSAPRRRVRRRAEMAS
jgi:hypothetical protein